MKVYAMHKTCKTTGHHTKPEQTCLNHAINHYELQKCEWIEIHKMYKTYKTTERHTKPEWTRLKSIINCHEPQEMWMNDK